jgi:hypothetical protein
MAVNATHGDQHSFRPIQAIDLHQLLKDLKRDERVLRAIDLYFH